MRTVWRVLPALALLAAAASPTTAQKKDKGVFPPIGLFGSGSLTLLENADVQKDLKLSDDQVKKITELAAKQKAAIAEIFKDLKGKEAFDKMMELTKANQKVIGDVLNAKQNERLKQLELQQRGPRAFADPKIAKDLGLSDEQTTKVREILKESAKKLFELFKDKPKPEEIQKKMAELNKGTTDELLKTLTDEQKKKWQELTGEPFQGTLPPSFFPGFGGVLPGGPVRESPQALLGRRAIPTGRLFFVQNLVHCSVEASSQI
jgi:hypothetical protein